MEVILFVDSFDELKNILNRIKNGEKIFSKFRVIVQDILDTSMEVLEPILTEAAEYFRGVGDIDSEGWCLGYLGWCLHYNGLYRKQIKTHMDAVKLLSRAEDKHGMIYSYNGLMAGYFQLGVMDLSVQCGVNAMKIAEEIDDKEFLLIIIVNMSFNYMKNKQYKEAGKFIKAIENMPIVESENYKAIINQTLAEIECETGDINRAFSIIDNALNLAEEKVQRGTIIEMLRVRGKIYTRMGEYSKASKDFEKALEATNAGGYEDIIPSILLEYADMEYRNKNNEVAIEKLNDLLNMSEAGEDAVALRDSYERLYEIYNDSGDYKNALLYYKKYMDMIIEFEKNRLEVENLGKEAEKYTDYIFKSLYDDMTVMSNIGQKITSDLDIFSALENIYSDISKIISVDLMGMTEIDDDGKTLKYSFYLKDGKSTRNLQDSDLDANRSIGAYSVNNNCKVIINDIYEEYNKYIQVERFSYCFPEIHSMMYCPIILEDKIKGYITVQSCKTNAYKGNDLNKLTILASYVAIAMENSYLYSRTKYYATHDDLTELLSRKEFFTKGEEIYKEHEEDAEANAFIMVDIDNFKLVNDNYGHIVGDRTIRSIGSIINNIVADYGIAGRYGGEEFIIILSGLNEEGIYNISNEIKSQVERLKIDTDNGNSISVTVSLGVFISNDRKESFDQCMSFADEALYIAKAEGKNKIVRYENY